MNVLIACEFSGVVRDAFLRRGHNAWSCDLLPSATEALGVGHHLQGDVRWWLDHPQWPWDLMIAHPDCTYLTNSAAWAFADVPMIKGKPRKIKPGTLIGAARRTAREDALNFVRELMVAPIERIAIENPVGAIGTHIRKADQYIQPYEFGHDASKRTGLWLKNLPKLKPTEYFKPRMVCPKCGYISNYDAAFGSGCWHCGAEAGLLKPRWANQTASGQNCLAPSADRWKLRAATYQGWADAMADQWG